ncbi:MAG: 4Fe-4S ferredoxin, partial [bacterium]|nr:4Fe-4S ferredoxin [bacterium]
DDQRDDILSAFPHAQTLVSFVCRMNREAIRTPARSIANLEFHHSGDEVDETGRCDVAALEARGIRALNVTMGFPMETDRWPGKMWVVAHKPVAVAAGLGRMGIHRNVIHPKFGNFILLGTVLVDATVDTYSQPLDYNPCLTCKLCVAACPTGAIHPDGHFDFAACYTHNYREFMGGFTDWVESIADAPSAKAYRKKVTDPESVSMWQSLSYGANYKAAYCLSVCPAGEDVIAPYKANRKQHLDDIVRPLQQKEETIYVLPNSDAEAHVARRFRNKRFKRIGNGLRPQSIEGFLGGLPLLFQEHQSKGLDATYHFTFTGAESHHATVIIRDQSLEVTDGHHGAPDLRLTADSSTWLRFLAKEVSILRALPTLRIRLRGNPRLLLAFARCFPS